MDLDDRARLDTSQVQDRRGRSGGGRRGGMVAAGCSSCCSRCFSGDDVVRRGCSDVGPFYCPADDMVYIDLGSGELRTTYGARDSRPPYGGDR